MPNSSAGHGWALKDSVHESLWTSGNILPQQMVDILDAYKEDEECSNPLRYMEIDEFEQAGYESFDDKSDHGESHN